MQKTKPIYLTKEEIKELKTNSNKKRSKNLENKIDNLYKSFFPKN